jgi:hypothetical protein
MKIRSSWTYADEIVALLALQTFHFVLVEAGEPRRETTHWAGRVYLSSQGEEGMRSSLVSKEAGGRVSMLCYQGVGMAKLT